MRHARLVGDAWEAYRRTTIGKDGTEVLLRQYVNGDVVVAFRGTEKNFTDILSDLAGWPDRHPTLGFCHNGFLEGVLAVWPEVTHWLGLAKATRVWFTGHSKGGSQACIAAGLLMTTWPNPDVGLVTFGAAGAGTWKLGRVLAAAQPVHYRNGVDCVPSHPWWTGYPSGYTQLGEWDFAARYIDLSDRFLDHRIAEYEMAVNKINA